MNNNFNLKHFAKPYILGLLIATTLIFAGACKTTKKKSDISPITKFYHSTTSLYNGYFNANVLMEEAVFDLTYDHEDNFSELLPIDKYMGSPHFKSAYSKLDTAIKKVSVVAAVHRVGEWTDDCYLLAGKAQYIKRDFDEAERTLKYLVKEFDPTNPGSQYWSYKKNPTEKNKKAKTKTKKGKKTKKSKTKTKAPTTREVKNKYEAEARGGDRLKKDPAFNEGRLWLAKTFLQKDMPGQAQGLINDVRGKYNRSKTMDNLFHTTQAEVYIYQNNYGKAANELASAMDYAASRDQKGRYAFIAAQLYGLDGNHAKATVYYDHAKKFADSYELVFNSELNQLKSAYTNGSRSRSSVLASLEKMTKDGKNVDYYDYIYFTMAEIYEHSGDIPEAIEHYTLALANKSKNTTVALDCYHALSNLYYTTDEFIPSDKYLDSTLILMNKGHSSHSEVSSLSGKIKPIAKNLVTIQDKDSLIAISKMSPEEQKAIAAEMKAKEEARKGTSDSQGKGLKGRQSGMSAPAPGMNLQPGPQPRQGKYRGSFFAYQEDNKAKREQTFKNVWGDIPLVDNWRVSSLMDNSLIDGGDDMDTDRSIDPADLLTEAELQRYLKDVPKNEGDLKQIDAAIIAAMEELGFLYRSNLDRPDLAVEILEELLRRYPDGKISIDAYYNLYLAYQTQGNTAMANKYREFILDKFPNSAIAKNIKNPSQESKEDEAKQKLALFYQSTYDDFQKGSYDIVHSRVQTSITNYGENNKYAAKFALLDAMALGKTKGESEYAQALREIIDNYKGSPEATHAREILRFLDGSPTAFGAEVDTGNFQIDDDKIHYIMVFIKNPKEVNRNNAKIKVSDFNEKYFGLDKLKVSTIFLDVSDNNNPIIIVRQFKDKKKAMNYYETAIQFKDNFMPDGAEYIILATNQQNYREILKTRTIVDYTEFFETFYLRGGR